MNRKDRREYIRAVNEALRRNPDLREGIEQRRQARSRTEGRDVSFNEMLEDVLSVGAKQWLKNRRDEETKGKTLVYVLQSFCPSDHPVTMLLGEYDDPGKAWEGLSKLMEERGLRQCPRCHSSELHLKFRYTNFHSRAELEASKAQWDVRN